VRFGGCGCARGGRGEVLWWLGAKARKIDSEIIHCIFGTLKGS
jgi:hypothetical protein